MTDKEHISTSIQDAFVSALRRTKSQARFLDEYPEYVREIEDNLVPGVTVAMFEPELSGGAGKELEWVDHEPPKFCAAFSSLTGIVVSLRNGQPMFLKNQLRAKEQSQFS